MTPRLRASLVVVVALACRSGVAEDVCQTFLATIDELVPSHFSIYGIEGVDTGTVVSGTIAFDRAVAGTPLEIGVEYALPRLEITMRVGEFDALPAVSPRADSPGLISVTNSLAGEGADVLVIDGSATFDPAEPLRGLVLFSLRLEDPTGAALDRTELPRRIDASRFTAREIETRSMPGDFRSFLFHALVHSLGSCGDPTFLRADVNGDGVMNIADPIRLFGFLFLGVDAPGCPKASDANDDGVLDISDGAFILNRLFLSGPAIPEPHPRCGTDPSADTLPCESAGTCL